ncbi:MAG: 1-(5-phosphoribosyl)-5-[(5-phosphoribosylamino)methylideneamino]imidazole-4-carboxamide isomerase [Actinomycetia bacterium]|nr:1-(5-phosphoribosyl)-5-[(5-phosphoribosylamino)methylideneamino]imidazole-4-carboxamide isomerase [Actinomycetes bacterium]
MLVIPAIDLIGGACVRLSRGKFDTKKIYDRDPVKVALSLKQAGASWIHIIDLDGARTGNIQNLEVAAAIKQITGVWVQMGGGIRDFSTLEQVLEAGIDRAILGTRAIEDIDFLEEASRQFEERICLSLDFDSQGRILTKGWQQDSGLNIFSFGQKIYSLGISHVIVTDVSRDGMLKGINRDLIKSIMETTGLNLIVAGGVSSMEDIRELRQLGVAGAITGKAIYEGKIDLKQAIREAGQ